MLEQMWNPTVARIMTWGTTTDGVLTNRLHDISLEDVVLVSDYHERPAGRWAVKVTLRTIPASALIVDGTLNNWWYKNDPRHRPAEERQENQP